MAAITENSRAELSWLTQLYESQKQHQQEQEEQEQNLEFLCNWETETQRVGSRSFDQSGAMAYGNESLPGEENT